MFIYYIMPPLAVANAFAQAKFASSLRPEEPRAKTNKRKAWVPLYKGTKAPNNNSNSNNNLVPNFKPLKFNTSGSLRKTIRRKSRKNQTRKN
jgi:hypothetical protein